MRDHTVWSGYFAEAKTKKQELRNITVRSQRTKILAAISHTAIKKKEKERERDILGWKTIKEGDGGEALSLEELFIFRYSHPKSQVLKDQTKLGWKTMELG